MRWIILFLLLLSGPLKLWADGMVVPTVAYPANITIPDQQAAISFNNGVERLVIETRFVGSGTNFAWVLPLPSRPAIEEATTGFFPTLQYLSRPEVIHEVPQYYYGILITLGFIYIVWRAKHSTSNVILAGVLILAFILFAAFMLPMLGASQSRSLGHLESVPEVTILDRHLAGIYDTVTLTSQDGRALENWLRDNGYTIASDAKPIIDGYLKDGWVFVASKVRRNDAGWATNSPHPLSFTFKTDRPVYPMRLTSLVSQSLNVALFYLGDTSAAARHFKVESSARRSIFHDTLRHWFGATSVITKLTANLSPTDMRQDVWLNVYPAFVKTDNRLYSRKGALTTALNWGAVAFAFCLAFLWGRALFQPKCRPLFVAHIGWIVIVSSFFVVFAYAALPKIDVKLVKGGNWLYGNQAKQEILALQIALDDNEWHSATDARLLLQQLIATNADFYGLRSWDNHFIGGQFREEDSPGNYLLRETNNQLELVLMDGNGGEVSAFTKSWPLPH